MNNTIAYIDCKYTCTSAILECPKMKHTFKYTIKLALKFSFYQALFYEEKKMGAPG